MAASQLASVDIVGPPELKTAVKQEKLASGDPFLDMLHKSMTGEGLPPLGLTENASATFLSAGNKCLDFFFQVVPSTKPARVEHLVEEAWKEDPLTALKLIFQLRGVRGTGKSDKQSFYTAALWLYNFHHATLAANARLVAAFGYYKDLLELVLRVVEGPDETARRMLEKAEHDETVSVGKAAAKRNAAQVGAGVKVRRRFAGHNRMPRGDGPGYYARKGAAAREAKKDGTLRPREDRIAEANAKDQAKRAEAAVLRRERKLGYAQRAVETYTKDPKYKRVYSVVAQVFADQLAKDLQALRDGNVREISLAAKWAPSLGLSYDQRTLLCEAIARRMFPREAHSELEEHAYVFRVRDRYRKEVLAPLRQKLELAEVYMSARRWEQLPYNRVPSVAMKMYKELFAKHDGERFKQFLEDVEAGKKKIAAGAVLPHKVLRDAVEEEDEATVKVAELQWKRMVEDLAAKGSLSNCLAVCDVSGSMSGEPMEVCIALGLLTAELCEEPWKDSVITFSATPQIHRVTGTSLAEKYQSVQQMDWGMNTNFQAVFDQILALAVRTHLPKEKMIKRLFVFSDMEFDEARGCGYDQSLPSWQDTDYAVICAKFRDAGYGPPPELVFWNLRDSASTPVMHDQSGVAMVSGFSKNLLKLFLQNDGVINPRIVMEQAIAGPLFQELILVD